MKLAPNVKQQSRGIKHKETEVIIFAGSDAWSHAKQWQEHDARMAGDNEPPVWLEGSSYPNWISCKLCRKAENPCAYSGPDILRQ